MRQFYGEPVEPSSGTRPAHRGPGWSASFDRLRINISAPAHLWWACRTSPFSFRSTTTTDAGSSFGRLRIKTLMLMVSLSNQSWNRWSLLHQSFDKLRINQLSFLDLWIYGELVEPACRTKVSLLASISALNMLSGLNVTESLMNLSRLNILYCYFIRIDSYACFVRTIPIVP